MERKAAVLLRKILVDEGHRWVTLIGEPGIGKSYIAQALLQDAFSRPLILDSCTWDKNANPQSVLRAHLPPDAPDGVDVIAGLAAAHDVILFDNMDADTGDWVGTVEALAEVVPCIVTDRKAWGGQKERDVRVGAMPEFAAVELFEQSARDEVESTAASRLASRIVTKLDHNPLAIKIAANRTQILTRKQLVDRLENDLDVLGGAPTAERHSSMREAFASAWAKLSPVDQKVLARTSVFHGNFGLHIFEAVVGHDDAAGIIEPLRHHLHHGLSMGRLGTSHLPQTALIRQ